MMDDPQVMLAAVDEFAIAMKVNLRKKAGEGYTGGLEEENRENVFNSLLDHVLMSSLMEGQEVDVANLAMMLWAGRMLLLEKERGG